MASSNVESELHRRNQMWADLLTRGGPSKVSAGLLRELVIYGGASGIWVNKGVTRDLTADGAGVAVAVLHNGSSYADEMSDDGLIYHFPATKRTGRRDAAEKGALIHCAKLGLPLFVITHSDGGSSRTVTRGTVLDIDEAAGAAFITFDLTATATAAPIGGEQAFRLDASRNEKKFLGRRLLRDPFFKFYVGKRVGWQCAVCDIRVPQLLDAAHIKGVAEGGSDDSRNGLLLCASHHRAFDRNLFRIKPDDVRVCCSDALTAQMLGITVVQLCEVVRPHVDALRWRWSKGLVPVEKSRPPAA